MSPVDYRVRRGQLHPDRAVGQYTFPVSRDDAANDPRADGHVKRSAARVIPMSLPAKRPIRGLATLLMLSTATAAWGQARDREIVVTGTREQQVALEEIAPERSVDEDSITSYGASTIGQVLEEIAAESGDSEELVLFVNGRPITDPGDIIDYPAEAISRIDVLPRGAGARLGAAPDKRAYNVVLKRVFKSYIGTVRSQLATQGGWHSMGGELNHTRISGQNRLNLTFRIRDDDNLLETERGIIQPIPLYPYALTGNVIADPRSGLAEIDPALSAAAGRLVTVAGIPAGLSAPILSDFASSAGLANSTDLGRFRTLKPAQRSYEASLNANRPIASWLSVGLTAGIDLDSFESLQGLRAGLFVLPPENPFAPFTRPVAIARYFDDDPLTSRNRFIRSNLGIAFNATHGKWLMTLRGDYRYSRFTNHTRRQRQAASLPILLEGEGGQSPFAGEISTLVPLFSDKSLSRTQDSQVQFSATGPLLALPAGALRANLNGGWRHVDQDSRTDSLFFQSLRSLDRDEYSAQGSLEIPLTSREQGFLGAVGDISVTLDYGLTDVSDLGTIRRENYALNWRPFPALHFQGAINKQRSVPDAQQLGEAITVTDGVRYFDVLTGETVDVTQIYGGNPDLKGERLLTKRASATVQLLPGNALQLNAEYLASRIRDPISLLPPTSVDLMAAFPERFQRDSSGRLASVDLRPLNFLHRSSEQFRWGLNLALPLVAVPPPGSSQARGASRLRQQFTLSHTIRFKDEVLTRAGFPEVDLLGGGAIGFGGGGTRHLIDAGLNINDREIGARFNATWRSASQLNSGSPEVPSKLHFSSISTFNLRTFAGLKQVWPDQKWLKGTRVSLNVLNLFNARQTVRDEFGATPLRYQRGYRDPIGRTVELEIRKVF